MNVMRQREIFTDAMRFASGDDEPATFLRLWLEGDWDALGREWPEYSIPVELRHPERPDHPSIHACSSGAVQSSSSLDTWLASQREIMDNEGPFHIGHLWTYRASEQYVALDLIAANQELGLTIAITGRLRLPESIHSDPFIETVDAVDAYYLSSLISHELNIPLSYGSLSGPLSRERLLRSSTTKEKDSCLSLKVKWPSA